MIQWFSLHETVVLISLHTCTPICLENSLVSLIESSTDDLNFQHETAEINAGVCLEWRLMHLDKDWGISACTIVGGYFLRHTIGCKQGTDYSCMYRCVGVWTDHFINENMKLEEVSEKILLWKEVLGSGPGGNTFILYHYFCVLCLCHFFEKQIMKENSWR